MKRPSFHDLQAGCPVSNLFLTEWLGLSCATNEINQIINSIKYSAYITSLHDMFNTYIKGWH